MLENGPGSSFHHPDHQLLRLHNLESESFERAKVDPTAAKIEGMETVVAKRFEAIETGMQSLGTRMQSLEAQVGDRLASLESLIRRIALQLNVAESKELTKSEEVKSLV